MFRKIFKVFYVVSGLRWARHCYVERRAKTKGNEIAASYFERNSLRKLHIGCGQNILSGWLNCDYHPHIENVMHINACEKMDLPSNAFDFIYTEHMIEHIPLKDARFMLTELYRLAKPGAIIRISTPDLGFLCKLMEPSLSSIQEKYIAWSHQQFTSTQPDTAAVIVNNFFKDWGHQFIFDQETLSLIMTEAGFRDCKICQLELSEHEDLCGLEHVRRLPQGFLKLESLIIEARKPPEVGL